MELNRSLRKYLINFHFITLIVVIVDIIVKNSTTYSIQDDLAFGLTITTLLSAVVLFFFFFMKRPFKNLSFYFSLYVLFAVIIIIGLIFRSILWFIILSILISPIYPEENKYEHNNIIISEPFQGLMSSCCSYKLKEKKFLIFEKDYGVFEQDDPINFETFDINETETEFELIYSTDSGTDKIKTIKK